MNAVNRSQFRFTGGRGTVERERGKYIFFFLKFAVYFLLDGFYKQITPMDCKPYLVRYAEAEKDSRTANMICEVIVLIFPERTKR